MPVAPGSFHSPAWSARGDAARRAAAAGQDAAGHSPSSFRRTPESSPTRRTAHAGIQAHPSFRRTPESSHRRTWTPAFAGVTGTTPCAIHTMGRIRAVLVTRLRQELTPGRRPVTAADRRGHGAGHDRSSTNHAPPARSARRGPARHPGRTALGHPGRTAASRPRFLRRRIDSAQLGTAYCSRGYTKEAKAESPAGGRESRGRSRRSGQSAQSGQSARSGRSTRGSPIRRPLALGRGDPDRNLVDDGLAVRARLAQ